MDKEKILEKLKRKSFNGEITLSDFDTLVNEYAELYHKDKLKLNHVEQGEDIICEHNETSDSNCTKNLAGFITIKLRRDTAENMISTYEFLAFINIGEDKKDCKRILKALKKALS